MTPHWEYCTLMYGAEMWTETELAVCRCANHFALYAQHPHAGWGDGTSRNDASLYEISATPGPLDESSRKQNVPALILYIPVILQQPKRIV